MKLVAYYRVSTDRQGRSGLGLQAQRRAVDGFVISTSSSLIAGFSEVESGSRNDRPQLDAALRACRLHCATLVIAKLDRLARNATFLLNLRDAGVDFIACDMPDANRLTIGIMALMAEHEREAISQRTKAALASAKERGTKLGGFRGYMPTCSDRKLAIEAINLRACNRDADLATVIREITGKGDSSLRGLASGLNQIGIPAPRGGEWHPETVARLLRRLNPA